MSFDPLSAAFSLGQSLIETIWPNPVEQAQEQRKLLQLYQDGDIAKLNAHVQIMTGQMKINMAEAQHKSIFVAGWRPFIGWTGGIALGYQFIVYPLMLWLWQIADIWVNIPTGVTAPSPLDGTELYTIVVGMLGMGAMRSFDKKNGVATTNIGVNKNGK